MYYCVICKIWSEDKDKLIAQIKINHAKDIDSFIAEFIREKEDELKVDNEIK